MQQLHAKKLRPCSVHFIFSLLKPIYLGYSLKMKTYDLKHYTEMHCIYIR